MLDGASPNVFLEIGTAIGMGGRVLLLASANQPMTSDLVELPRIQRPFTLNAIVHSESVEDRHAGACSVIGW